MMDYFYPAAGGDATGCKHPGAGIVGVCSRERFKQLLKGLWRTHFSGEQVDELATRYAPGRDSESGQARRLALKCLLSPRILRSHQSDPKLIIRIQANIFAIADQTHSIVMWLVPPAPSISRNRRKWHSS